MIKKSIIISTILLFVYNLLLSAIDFPVKPGHQWQDNIITAEDYIYKQNEKKIVIAGSSLSCVLIDDLLPKKCFNLAFAGLSAFDGLEIIKRTGSMPDIVLIETNPVFRSTDKNFLNSIFMPIRYSLKKIFPAFMEKKPTGVFIEFCHFLVFVKP